MRFEVRYPTGSQAEIELSGSVAVLGRDPSCDLVLNDAKCSRRHAVVEAGPQGIAIRDAGSANGIYVNGQKVDRANLVTGDVVRLGEVVLKVLAEEVAGTVVMAEDDLNELNAQAAMPTDRTASVPPMASPLDSPAPAAAHRPLPRATPPPENRPPAPVAVAPAPPPPTPVPPAPPPPPPVARPSAPPPPKPAPMAPPPAVQRPRPSPQPRPVMAVGPGPRPLTITALAVLWLLGVILYPVAGLGLAAANGWRGAAWGWIILGATGFVTSAVMAWGLWARLPWARPAQIALAGVGILSCLFLPPSAVILAYMFRESVAGQFAGRRPTGGDDEAEPFFTAGIVFAATIPFLLLALLGVVGVALPSFPQAGVPPGPGGTVNVGRLKAVHAAEQAFSSGTCGAFADLEGLLKPATVIPNYPASGLAFLAEDLAQPESGGYRYELRVLDPVPPTEGCPTRSFRRFFYSATPISGVGRHYGVGSDGVIRAAEGRPVSSGDPPVE